MHNIDALQPLESLKAYTLSTLQSVLSGQGSSLSGDGLEAIEALIATLSDGIGNNLGPYFYLSSIDPGMGKTLAVSLFLKAWKASGFLPASSVLIGVSRLKEIEGYLKNAGLEKNDIAVLTSEADMNALGVKAPQHPEAPIMFTTQQMIQSRAQGRTFAEASEFYFKGEPRFLRIWDESLLPALPVTLSADALGLLPAHLRNRYPDFVKEVTGFQKAIWQAELGMPLEVPRSLCEALPSGPVPDGLRDTLAALKPLGEAPLTPVEIDKGEVRLVGSVQALPEDFAPVVILDASGRVRESYRLWETHRGNLKRLPAAHNEYDALRVHLWQRASGKVTLSNPSERSAVAQAIADRINRDEVSRWLIVHYKDHPLIDEISMLVQVNAAQRINGLTWGMHHGTNEFAAIENVVIVGQLNYGEADYPAHFCAASGLPASASTPRDIEALVWGEFQHNLLQALCRGSVRRSAKGIAGFCNAYVITTPSAAVGQKIADTFPGCQMLPWVPTEKPLRGKVAQAAEYLRVRFEEENRDSVMKKEVREHLEMDAANFSNGILRHKQFRAYLAGEGIGVFPRAFKFGTHFEPYEGGEFFIDEME